MSNGAGPGSAGTSNNQVCVAALDKPGYKTLTETGARVEYANGYIVYVLRGTLVAHRFDPDRLTLSGDPIPLADRISENSTRALFSVSTDGKIAFQAGTTGVTSELIWLDRQGKELGKIGPPDSYLDIALSPDGSQIAYSLNDSRSDTRDIWVRDLARDTASRLTFDPANEVSPLWSPDGARVFYMSNRSGFFACVAKAANGTGRRATGVRDRERERLHQGHFTGRPLARVSAGSPRASSPRRSWSPPMARARRFACPGMGCRPRARCPPTAASSPTYSNETGTPEVYVQTWPLGGGKWQISNGGGLLPRWRGDGKELFYRNAAFEFYAVTVTLEPRFTAGIPNSFSSVACKETTQGRRRGW